MTQASAAADPHHDQPLLTAGVPLSGARAALIMIHGRGARAENILETASRWNSRPDTRGGMEA